MNQGTRCTATLAVVHRVLLCSGARTRPAQEYCLGRVQHSKEAVLATYFGEHVDESTETEI